MLNHQHGRMILESVENGPLLWPTVEEDGVTRLKKYSELSAVEAIKAECDVKATNIILQGLPLKVYALVSTHKVAKELWERIQMLMQGTSLTKQERECKLYDEFDKFAYRKGESLRHMSKQCTKPKRKRDVEWFKDKVLLVQAQANGQVLQEEELEFLVDPGTAETSSTHSHALQDDLILSMIEQLKTQVVNCTKINQDNKNVNEILTAELKRYKNLERILKEQKNDDKASASYKQSLEIKTLKHTLSEHLKDKKSLEQKITLLKMTFSKRNLKILTEN
nr:hypothetical protein [Tanacetum cinerariifolium]